MAKSVIIVVIQQFDGTSESITVELLPSAMDSDLKLTVDTNLRYYF